MRQHTLPPTIARTEQLNVIIDAMERNRPPRPPILCACGAPAAVWAEEDDTPMCARHYLALIGEA